MALISGVSARTIDYYTQRGLLEPAERSTGHQRRYAASAVRRLHLIKELQAERLTLREITERLAVLDGGPDCGPALAARIRSMDEELDRLNHELAAVAEQLERAASPDDRRAVAQVASLALAKTLALAQWLATVARDGQTPLA